MATQIRSKQPRPLSIISESSLDDYLDSCFQTESANDAKESNDLDKQSQPRPARRISVAPLEHPVDALDQGNGHTEDCTLQDNLVISGTECTSEKSNYCQNNCTKKDVLERSTHSGDTVAHVQNVDSIQHRLFSANDARCKPAEEAGAGLPTSDLSDHDMVRVDVNTNTDHGNKPSKFTDQQTNLELGTSMSKNELGKSEDKPKPLSGSERWSNERRKLCSALNLNVNANWAGKFSDVNNMTKAVTNTNISNVECQKLDEKETLSNEQKAWRNKVRKSSSFTFSSVKARPLRRSMGSFDFKNASFLARTERRSLAKRDSSGSDNSSNPRAKFYISSDVCDDQTEFTLGLESIHNCVEQGHSRQLSFCGNRSWDGLSSIPRDGSPELSFARLHSLPNLEQLVTSQQSQISNSQSGELPSETPPYKARKHTYTDSQPNSLLVRRISAVDQSDLRSLQALATRLNLPTRRLSTTIWKEKYLGRINIPTNVSLPKGTCLQSESGENDKDTKLQCGLLADDDSNSQLHDRLALVREDLIKMRLQDQALAAQFLKIRHQMVELRLAVECQNYMELLDGAQEDIEEERELSRMVDIPSELLSPHYSLLHVGLTKMNFASRRFSTC